MPPLADIGGLECSRFAVYLACSKRQLEVPLPTGKVGCISFFFPLIMFLPLTRDDKGAGAPPPCLQTIADAGDGNDCDHRLEVCDHYLQ